MIPLEDSPPQPPTTLVFWIVWFAILNGLLMIQFFVGGGIPSGVDQGNPPLILLGVGAGLVVVALGIRVLLLPRLQETSKKLPAMVVGLALSDGVGMLGVFGLGKEFAASRLALFLMSIGCILSFAPVYVSRVPREG